MAQMFIMGGPFMWILLLITLTIVALAVRDVAALSSGRGLNRMRSRNGSGAILFWGCLAAVLGFLASFTGLFISLSIIRQHGVMNPNLLAEGIMAALITTIFGLLILAFSAVAWFVLRWWSRRAPSGGSHAAAGA